MNKSDLAPHQLYIVQMGLLCWDQEKKTLLDPQDWMYHSAYIDRALAAKACVINQHEDSIAGLKVSRYRIVEDTVQTELPEQDPGMLLTDIEIEERAAQYLV